MLTFTQRYKKHIIFIHRYFIVTPLAAWLFYKGEILLAAIAILVHLVNSEWPLDLVQIIEDFCCKFYRCVRNKVFGVP